MLYNRYHASVHPLTLTMKGNNDIQSDIIALPQSVVTPINPPPPPPQEPIPFHTL